MVLGMTAAAADEAAVSRGEYLFRAAACASCHTDVEQRGGFIAGGREMATQFGTFRVPNITPDPETGLGDWQLDDFRKAMIDGLRPDGNPYYPVFPYRWYTGMTEQDVADLWAYLQSVEPVRNPVADHQLNFPFSIRSLLWGWRLLNFDSAETVHDDNRSDAWNRGAYLVNHLGHCGACHTPTDALGGFQSDDRFLAGSTQIPGIHPAPNITPDSKTGLGDWRDADIVRALKRAITPRGTPIRGPMAEYVEYGSSYLTDDDLNAMATYLKSLPAVFRATEPSRYVTGREHQGSEGVRSLIASGDNLTRAK